MKRWLALADEHEDSDQIRWKDGSEEGIIKREHRRGTKVCGVRVWICLQTLGLADVGAKFLGSSKGSNVHNVLELSHQKDVV
jgi:hypothetical protein